MSNMRKVRVYSDYLKKEDTVRIGVFHCWGLHSQELDVGGLIDTVAIVEFEDGTVEEIYPACMQFKKE